MVNEDLKVLTFRLEKAAFILGKVCGAVHGLSEKWPASSMRDELLTLSECLATDCGELYYPKPYFVAKVDCDE